MVLFAKMHDLKQAAIRWFHLFVEFNSSHPFRGLGSKKNDQTHSLSLVIPVFFYLMLKNLIRKKHTSHFDVEYRYPTCSGY